MGRGGEKGKDEAGRGKVRIIPEVKKINRKEVKDFKFYMSNKMHKNIQEQFEK